MAFTTRPELRGTFGMVASTHWLASAAGMLPATVLYVYLGAAGGAAATDRSRGPLEWALLGAGLLATLAVTVVLTRKARGHLAAREKA